MKTNHKVDRVILDDDPIRNLVASQFPQWSHLPIQVVEPGGWDNRSFRLGDDMLIRLPSAERYAVQVAKEQTWLPRLAPYLSVRIPKPLAMGKPDEIHPWSWSVYRWIEGETVSRAPIDDMNQLAIDLTQFLTELHKIPTDGGPAAGAHNFYRGGSLEIYDSETRSTVEKLKDQIDAEAVLNIWRKALNSTWENDPVWVHGDFSADNLLVNDGRLTAIIDFGGLGVGDPACDLVIVWTYLNSQSRKTFRGAIGLDTDTWDRAKGWALWKALITLAPLEDRESSEALRQLFVIERIIHDRK